MKKKLLSVLLCASLVVVSLTGLTACGNKEEETSSSLTPIDEIRDEMFKDIESLVDLGDYKSMSVTSVEETVTDKDIQDYIDNDLNYYGEAEHITEGTVASGDTVNIDYVGKIDGTEFDGGSAEGADLTIGSGAFIPGFEDQLIDAAIGETKVINVTFPEDYQSEDVAGKDAEFTVKINYKQGDLIPAVLNDELVASMGLGDDVKTVDDYKAYVKAELEAEAAEQQENNDFTAILEELLNICTVNGYHDDLDQDQMYEEEIAYMQQYAESYSMNYDEFVALYTGMTAEDYEAQLVVEIENYCKRVMIYRAIAANENIEITQEEYEAEVAQYSGDYANYNCESVEEFEEQYSLQIYQYMIYDRIESMLGEDTTVTRAAATAAPENTATEEPTDAAADPEATETVSE